MLYKDWTSALRKRVFNQTSKPKIIIPSVDFILQNMHENDNHKTKGSTESGAKEILRFTVFKFLWRKQFTRMDTFREKTFTANEVYGETRMYATLRTYPKI